jgi:drug/metabolite transporter (DMT)-like permease
MLPIAAGLGAIALWSFLALLSRVAQSLPPLQVTAMAFAVSAVFGLAVVAARGRLAALRQPPVVWLHGVGGLAGYHALYFAALRLAPPAEANLLNYLWPLLIVLFAAPLLRLRLTWRHLLGAGLAACGCALLLGGRLHGALAPLVWLGYAMALGAAITWALYSVLARRLAAVPTDAVAGFCAASAGVTFLAHLALEPTVVPDGAGWFAILALGLGPLGGAFYLWDIGMKRGDPRLLGTLAYATPVASTLLLVLSGFAPGTPALLLAALLVAGGGVLAARG